MRRFLLIALSLLVSAGVTLASGSSFTVAQPTRMRSRSGVTVRVPPFRNTAIVIRVGQELTLLIPPVAGSTGPRWLVHADPHYLQLLSSGPAPDPSKYQFRWRAIAAGNTSIVLDPLCLPAGCALPSFGLAVAIVPKRGAIVTLPPLPTKPIRLRVGGYLTLLMPVLVAGGTTAPRWAAGANDPSSLRLVGAGTILGSLTYYYRWRALKPGRTIIGLTPTCYPVACSSLFPLRATILPSHHA